MDNYITLPNLSMYKFVIDCYRMYDSLYYECNPIILKNRKLLQKCK